MFWGALWAPKNPGPGAAAPPAPPWLQPWSIGFAAAEEHIHLRRVLVSLSRFQRQQRRHQRAETSPTGGDDG